MVFVDIDPAGVCLAFAQSLYDILLEAIGLDRPSAQNGLEDEYLFVRSGRGSIRMVPGPAAKAALHSRGISESTLIRVRTSSLRFVSWVEVAFIVCGQRPRRARLRRWNPSTPK